MVDPSNLDPFKPSSCLLNSSLPPSPSSSPTYSTEPPPSLTPELNADDNPFRIIHTVDPQQATQPNTADHPAVRKPFKENDFQRTIVNAMDKYIRDAAERERIKALYPQNIREWEEVCDYVTDNSKRLTKACMGLAKPSKYAINCVKRSLKRLNKLAFQFESFVTSVPGVSQSDRNELDDLFTTLEHQLYLEPILQKKLSQETMELLRIVTSRLRIFTRETSICVDNRKRNVWKLLITLQAYAQNSLPGFTSIQASILRV